MIRYGLLCAAILGLTLPAFGRVEYVFKGDPKQLSGICSWADEEAQKLIDAKLVPGEHKEAMVFCLTLRRLSRYRTFKEFTFTDEDINQLAAFADFLWSKPAGHLQSAGHRMLGATAASYKIKLRCTRAKDLFGDDAAKYWSIPKEKEDPKRKYTFKLR